MPHVPGRGAGRSQATLQEVAGPKAEVKAVGTPANTNASPLRADVVSAVTRALHIRYPGLPVIPMQESGLSDALYTRGIGIPTYGVSAGFIKDTDNHMHGSNEGIPVDSFYNYIAFWHSLLTDLASSPLTLALNPRRGPWRVLERLDAVQQAVDLGLTAT